MKLKKADGLKMTETIKIGVPSKDDEANILLCGSDAISHNGIVWIHFPFQTDFACVIKSKPFEQALKSTSREEIDIYMEDNTLFLKAEDMEAEIQVLEDMEMFGALDLVQSEIANTEWDELPSNFLEGLSLCQYSISDNPSYETHCALHIYNNDILSTDRKRCSHYTLESPFPGKAMFLKKTIPFIIKFNPSLCINLPNRVHFADENGIVLTTQKIEGEYDYEGPRKIFTMVNESWKATELPERLKEILDNITEFYEGDAGNKSVGFSFEPDKIVIFSNDPGKSKIKRLLQVETAQKKVFEFRINPNFLRQYLEHSNEIVLPGGDEKFVLLRKENFEHLIAMMMVI